MNKEQIIELIVNPRNRELIQYARHQEFEHKVHVAGIGVDAKITKIKGLETDDAISLRRSLQQKSTKPIMANVLRPMDKIFSARGGSVHIDIENEKDEDAFKDVISNSWNGRTVRNWMEEVWKQKVNIDSFGLAFIENSKNEKGEIEFKLTYKSSSCIYDIGYKSFTNIQYIIFEPIQIEINKKKYNAYRVIDTEKDLYILQEIGEKSNDVSKYLIIGEDIDIEGFDIYPNEFYIKVKDGTIDKRVPACFLSNNLSEFDLKMNCTYIEDALIPADGYLLDSVINRIYKLRNGIPYVYEYERDCPRCDGTGYVGNTTDICPFCQGSGKAKNRDVSDVIILPVPETKDDPTLTPPAGYVQPDLDTWTKQEETLDRLKKEMYASAWGEGAVIERESTSGERTAYEIAVKQASVLDKLNRISSNAETNETYLTNLIGFFMFPSFKGANIQYGRRYDTKTSSEIWNEYLSAKEKKADFEILNDFISEYYYSVYKNNKYQLEKHSKILKTKPFFHYDTDTILSVRDSISEVDYLGNLYYSEFLTELQANNIRFNDLSISEIKTKLNEFIQTKINTNETRRNNSSENN